MSLPFPSLVATPADLLALEVEELAGILLLHLNGFQGVSANTVYQHGSFSHHNFFNGLRATLATEYGNDAPFDRLEQALMEAWAWLQSAGLLVEKANSYGSFFISRRGQQIVSREDFSSYRNAGMLPKTQLHPLLTSRIYPSFMRGDYETAIFQSFREVEIAVRNAGKFPPELVGDKLMHAAFAPAKGPLVDAQLPAGEQEAMGHLFAGAFGFYRNSTGHRYVPTRPEEAAEVIMFASQLLRIIDRVTPSTSGMTP